MTSDTSVNDIRRRLFIYDQSNNLRFLVDTGADLSVLPRNRFTDFHKNLDIILTAANGSIIHTYGKKMLKVDLNLRRLFPFVFNIADIEIPIIGADFLSHFGLLVDLQNKRLIDNKTSLSTNCSLQNCSLSSIKIFPVENEFTQLLLKFRNLISSPDYNSPVRHSVKHYIITEGHLPFSRPRRLDAVKFKLAQNEFNHMTELGICKPSSSSVSSPLHMVAKKSPTIGALAVIIVN